MSQQINLYQPIFRRQKKVFSAATILQIVAIISLGLAAIYGFGRWQVNRMRNDVALLESQQKQALAQFEQISREVAALQDDKRLSAQILATEQDLAARQQLLKWLGEREPGPAQGFAAQLGGLARQHRGELWLESIRLDSGGRHVSLEGGSHDPAAVVRYLRRLGREPAFAGLEFDSVKLERKPEAQTEIHFRVSNGGLDGDATSVEAGQP